MSNVSDVKPVLMGPSEWFWMWIIGSIVGYNDLIGKPREHRKVDGLEPVRNHH
jgi:hypothetical protein